MAEKHFDFLFIGGGILGSAGAMCLAEKLDGSARIGVIDVDLEGEHSSTLKNAGGVRSTWRNRANIELCKYSIDFYETIREEVQFRQHGYYWMHGDKSWEEIQRNYPLYVEYGLNVELYAHDRITDILPFVDNTEGIAGVSISRKSGLLDHYSLREYYREKARKLGVEFVDGCFVTDIAVKDGSVTSVKAVLLYSKGMDGGSADRSEAIKDCLLSSDAPTGGEELSFGCGALINTAGAWAPRIAQLYGFTDSQVKPRRRQMVVINCPDVDLSGYGMVIDTSDVYFHKDAENILVGYSNIDEEYGYNIRFDFGGMDEDSPFFRYIWSPLYNRISKFERLKFLRGWAGLYAETPDRSGFLGRVPGLLNVYECCAQTGRGLMISYGAGTALADLITDGELRQELRRAGDLSRERPAGGMYEQLHL